MGILAEPLADCVIPGRFLSFQEAQSLICKMRIERSLYHWTVQRATFINNLTTSHAVKESFLGFEYHEAGPWGYHISHSPLADSQDSHAPAAVRGPDQPLHPSRRGPWPPGCSSCGFFDPLPRHLCRALRLYLNSLFY